MNHTPHNLVEVISFSKDHGLNAELVGRWVWVRFDAKPDESTRKALKDFGFRWVPRRGMWANNCGHPSRHGIAHPFNKYGHVPVTDLDIGRQSAA